MRRNRITSRTGRVVDYEQIKKFLDNFDAPVFENVFIKWNADLR